MRSVGVDVDGLPTRGLAKVCRESVPDDRKVVQEGVKDVAHGISEEVESRKYGEENGGRVELRQAQTAPQKQHELQHLPQSQSQSSVVRWDRFLPLRSLKVLLVENDDSTRHVVGALLRNCSYEVTSVSNGLEAWKMLADLTNHIDLVLTEVAMPGLSGIALLSKIMNHKTCKNIPVIMTSSNDSMGIVFKCLSKGAVDFLVKPIRKNELKNLWQHVWRKCHSSSGSGSESGTRTQKSIKSKNVQDLDNQADSNTNDEDEERSIGLNYRNGSDNGSRTQQSSWSKRAVEVDSPRPMSPWEGSADPPDSTCALVIHSKPEVDSISWVPANATKKSQKQNDLSDNMAMGKDLTIGVLRDTDLQKKGPNKEILANATHIEKRNCANADLEKVRDKLRSLEYHNDSKKDKLLGKDSDLMDANTNITMACGGSAGSEVPYDSSKSTTILKEKAPSNTKELLPSVMPSLKRPRESNAGTTTQERNVLRHSDNSAFSRYNTVSTANQATTAVVGSCSPANNSSEAAKAESMLNLQSNSSGTPNQGSNGSSNNNDMGSTTNKVFTKSEVLSEKPAPKSTTLSTRPNSAFQPVQHGHNSSLQPVTSGKPDAANTTPGQQSQVEHHHHHHYHHHHHHVHQQQLNHDDLSLRNMITESPQFGQSNMSNGGVEDDDANYGSASGSNNGSDGQNGSSTAVVMEEMKMASDVGVGGTGKCGTVEAIVTSGNRISMDQDRLAQREAALNKFRLKRKERCFDKKVRYQSRKKLAEQRPRVRGQFVRQTVDENQIKDKSNNPDS